MNLFFGVKVNAARGLAVQVNSAVTQFVTSFTTAVNPQITKSYAKRAYDDSFKLVMFSSKYSYFLMALLAVPIFAEAPFILKLWLKEVPDYTVLFVRLTLINALIMTLSTSLYTLAIATGNIKLYQIVVGSLSVSCFFITYVLYHIGAPVEAAYFVSIVINIIIMFARLIIVSRLTGIKIRLFVSSVLKRVVIVSLLTIIGTYLCYLLFPHTTFLDASLVVILSILIVFLSVYFAGLSKPEKNYLLAFVKEKMRKR
jgi:O-antigen/teichoic acid export membrane protein